MLTDWYPHYVGDYSKKTAHLTMMEHGAYRLLLDHYYATGKPITNDVVQLHRICRAFADAERDAIDKILSDFFVLKNGFYHHERADREIEKRISLSDSRKQAADKRWKKKKCKSISKSKEIAGDLHMPTTTTTTNKKIIQKKPEGVSDSVWDDFIKHRKQKKAPLTETAMIGIENQAREAGWSLESALVEICSRGWTGFNAGWVSKEEKKGKGRGRITL